MSSQSKIEANRANAQKSTGPRTAEGKARSSRNSTVHAFTSESPLLPDEDPADLQTLCDAYFADLRPEGQAEEDLVERIAVAQYRLRRVPLLEAGFFDLRLRMRPLPECHNQDGKANLMWHPLGFTKPLSQCSILQRKAPQTELQYRLGWTRTFSRKVRAGRTDERRRVGSNAEGKMGRSYS